MNINKFKPYQIILFILINILLSTLEKIANSNNQSIEIHSTSQLINTPENIIIFKDHVVLKYKNIRLCADKIIINHNTNNYKLIKCIKAYGHPVIFQNTQKKTSDIITSAQANTICYDIENNSIIFNGNVYIKQLGNSIHSDNIVYSINEKKIQATSNTNGNTTAILVIHPS
ncbi:lipopolysaccharide transport periplasmic protein [Candidatus Blochmanniella vafra str. BVAF]|uniref:Lipopolysaccharide transport periplasmic protein n=1 Tax=Blochmanniella vafra (strain BVAF) TaxID=859654 RepID=E8Q6L5_BLOVB|nr:lipopolysaccharide transport periplasmic protein LptA [Candidatus Blochmannia vafer]ADV33456.1 lipopolysaccharide transport periplasmic protein [Candidatus Blochmannia vafer str. BVAF]